MLTALIMMLQTAPLADDPPPPARIDLTKLSGAAAPCDPAGDDIVICGTSDAARYRLRPITPPASGAALPPATAKLGAGTIDLRATQQTLPGGSGSGAAVTIKLPF